VEPLGPNDPTRIGRYRLAYLLGTGGMGKVYLAHTGSGRKVAVKVIRADYVHHDEYRTRFAREATAARQVGGFHTAPVVDADANADEPWIASEYIPGPSLHQAVTTHGPLPEDSLRVLAVGLAEGLEAIHEHGLVHRDLKPANIILADDGPRIIDFGISRPTEDTRITNSGALLGTPAYMAPEQAEGERPEPAVDVFSLGDRPALRRDRNQPLRSP
jgi:serine/threonine protein kinase